MRVSLESYTVPVETFCSALWLAFLQARNPKNTAWRWAAARQRQWPLLLILTMHLNNVGFLHLESDGPSAEEVGGSDSEVML